MGWNQFGDFIDLDPDPHSSNFVDPNPQTIKPDPHHWFKTPDTLSFTYKGKQIADE